MDILERKIVHDANTICSHVCYTSPCRLHRHKEIQVILFTQGSGKQFVGNGVLDFNEGDVALIGSYVPHFHLCSTMIEDAVDSSPGVRETVQISPDIFPADMAYLPDYQERYALLEKSRYGIRFYDQGLYDKLKALFAELDSLRYTDRIAHVYRILGALVKCRDTRLIAPAAVETEPEREQDTPAGRALDYLYSHFREEVRLEDVAAYARTTPTALCRTFRKATDKTIFTCLNDIRIEYACRLLAYSNLTISQVGYESGYNSIAYFTKLFRQKLGHTPGEYRGMIRTT